MEDKDQKLDAMISKHEINEVLMRYARGVDRADQALLKSCYHGDAIEEHGSTYDGPAHDYIDGAIERIRSMGTMCHYLCNVHIELNGDTAYSEAYVLTFARFNNAGNPVDTLTGGRLCDRFERRRGVWKIAHRKLAFDWNRDMPMQESWCLGLFNPEDPKMVMGSKDQQDLSYQRF